MSNAAKLRPEAPGYTALALAVQRQLKGKPLATWPGQIRPVNVIASGDALWITVTREGKGGVAMRAMPPSSGPITCRGRRQKSGGVWRVNSVEGEFVVKLAILAPDLIRVTTELTPKADLLIPFWPRDIYPISEDHDATRAAGWVEAAQRGLNTGLCFFCLDKPRFGSVLYMQNLTALNPYFGFTKTKPDGVVGGEWPELGYQPPTAPLGNSPPVDPLPAGGSIIISDAFLSFRDACANDEAESATMFVDMMGDIYPHLRKPETAFHDWIARANQTLRDLQRAPDATIEHYGHTYLHPYTAAEYPDSMVQMAITAPLAEYAKVHERGAEFAETLLGGMTRFFDMEMGCVRRYLPNVGKDKNKNAVDSWYLYHPLTNLGRLALAGDKKAQELFVSSMPYALKAAHHFKYIWPIQYDVRDFSVITAARNDQGLGQTDVGGIYAYVMLQAHALTGEAVYLREAKAALRALQGMRFELAYQTNLTAWGATACMKLYRLEKDPAFLAQSHVFIAGFLHNCKMWESEIERAKNYTDFLGATCLHDAPYLAAFECFESFDAFDEYLRVGDREIRPSVKLLLSEYRRYALDRAWYFYPDALKMDAVARDDIRNGRIDRTLSFPLEDLYGDGQPAGQVGQEIYGAGGAFTFATRAFFPCENAPFRLFADYPAIVECCGKEAIVRLDGPPGCSAAVRVLKKGRRALPRISANIEGSDDRAGAKRRAPDFREYGVPADGTLRLRWS